MAKFKIEYVGSGREDETVEADHFNDTANGEWIDFYATKPDGGSERVLRVKAQGVARIEREQ